MTLDRQLARIRTLPAPARGQFGPDHTVIEVIRPEEWADSDPFILLMDDRIHGQFQGGPHPHVGFETVSFLVSGEIGQESGLGRLQPGDVEWTTAGKGIVHGAVMDGELQLRLLQLWLTLPKKDRWTDPDNQYVPRAEVPVRREPGAEVHVFSGNSGPLRSPTRNRVPVTIIDARLESGAAIEQALPLSFNGFFYVLEGVARIGTPGQELRVGQVGWLDRPAGEGEGSIRIANEGPAPLRVLLYAGERQNVPIVSYGPFIGDTRDDIVRAFEGYRAGTFRKY